MLFCREQEVLDIANRMALLRGIGTFLDLDRDRIDHRLARVLVESALAVVEDVPLSVNLADGPVTSATSAHADVVCKAVPQQATNKSMSFMPISYQKPGRDICPH